MPPGPLIAPSNGASTGQVTSTKSAIPKEKTLAGVCLSLLGASPLVPTDTPPPFSSRLSRCSHLDCRAALVKPSAMAPMRFARRSEEHTSELQSLMRISYAVYCLKKKKKKKTRRNTQSTSKHQR